MPRAFLVKKSCISTGKRNWSELPDEERGEIYVPSEWGGGIPPAGGSTVGGGGLAASSGPALTPLRSANGQASTPELAARHSRVLLDQARFVQARKTWVQTLPLRAPPPLVWDAAGSAVGRVGG